MSESLGLFIILLTALGTDSAIEEALGIGVYARGALLDRHLGELSSFGEIEN